MVETPEADIVERLSTNPLEMLDQSMMLLQSQEPYLILRHDRLKFGTLSAAFEKFAPEGGSMMTKTPAADIVDLDRARRWAGNVGYDGYPTSVPMRMITEIEALRERVAELKALNHALNRDRNEVQRKLDVVVKGLTDIANEAEREKGGWVHLKRVIGINARLVLASIRGETGGVF